jgi:hypothetical protein
MDAVSIPERIAEPGRVGGARKPASRMRALRRLEWVVGAYAVILIGFSIGMFMMKNTSENVGNLITTQNDAALKLWVNLDYFEHHRDESPAANTSLPPGLFESLVEFSRTNASIIKTVHRLRPSMLFASTASLDEVLTTRLKPKDGTGSRFDHIGVDPHTDANNVVKQGMYQIELYQAIRDYAQDQSSFYKDCLGAVSVYVMPVLYALLGAFLWAFRSSCQKVTAVGAVPADPAPDRTSRFVMAAIAGIAISVFGSVLPKDTLVSPLAMAFVFGYSIDIFTSRLDGYIETLSKPR